MEGTHRQISRPIARRPSRIGKTHTRTALAALVTISFAVRAAANDDPAREAHCIESSAQRFAIPAALLRAIRKQEGGTVGQWHVNADGSVDYGVMQINSRWLPQLNGAGYSATVLVYDACASIDVGAWILARCLVESRVWNATGAPPPVYWRAVGRYHSRTPALNRLYAEQVWRRYQAEVRS